MLLAKTNELERNVGVDLLRGLSILFVVLLHINIHFALSDSFLKAWLPAKLFNVFFWSGYHGVVVFFVISGYLITASSIKRWQSLDRIEVKTCYLIRAARILPLLLVLVLLLSLLHLLGVSGFTLNTNSVSLGQAVFSVLTFHMNWLQINVGYLPANWDVLWSISIEEMFYVFFPLLCFVVRRERLLILLLLIFFFSHHGHALDCFPAMNWEIATIWPILMPWPRAV